MRAIRWMVLTIALLAGIAGIRTSAEAAPLPVSSAIAQTQAGQGVLVEKAYWRHRRYGYRPYYRRHYYRPRFYGYRRHYWHRPYYRRRFYY